MHTGLVEFLKKYLNETEDKWRINLKNNMPELFKDSIQKEITDRTINKMINILKNYFSSLNLSEAIAELISLEKPTNQVMQYVELFNTSAYEVLKERNLKTDAELIEILLRLSDVKQKIYNGLLLEYEAKYKEIINKQKLSLKELSTPIIPVFDGIMVVPIVGGIDYERSQLMMETLLNAVVKNKTNIILIDITGVSVVDADVAYHLSQFVSAIHIVGAKSMLVGIKPEVAQALSNLNIDLANIVTLGNLQEGIEKALKLTNRKISEVS